MRELTQRDREILRKLAPEIREDIISPSGHTFKAILPPVSHHFAESAQDFKKRMENLDKEDLEYLADLILQGEETLRMLMEEDREVFLEILEEKLPEKAEKIKEMI